MRGWRFAVFLVTFLTIWAAVHGYVFWRSASVPFVASRIPRAVLVGSAIFLGLSYVAARSLERAGVNLVAAGLEMIGATWMGVLFLAFTTLLAVDVITGFGYLLPRLAPSLRGWALGASAVLSVVALVQGFRAPVVSEHEIALAGLPAERDGTVLVAVSDLHLGTLLGKGWLTARVAQVEALRPDLVVLVGDILEGDSPRERELIPLLHRFSAPLGVYAVTGNHEFYAGLEASVRLLSDAGFDVLRDRWTVVRPGLILAGVDDLTARRQMAQDGRSVERALAGRPPGATVFLSHSPWQAGTAARAGVGLMLSGHTHAGQIWPFGALVRLNYPLVSGRYDVGGMPVLVCRGTGTWGPRMRLWQRAEILRITLRSAPSPAERR